MIRPRVGEIVCAQPGQILPLGGEESYIHNMLRTEDAMAIGAIICAQPEVVFDGARLWNEFVGRQGEHPAWLAARSGPIRTAIRSVVPTGGVVKTSDVNTGRPSKEAGLACQAVRDQAAEVLAVSGAGIQWSLENPDTSVQHLLGRPRVSTATDGTTQYGAPWARYKSCAYLAGREGGATLDVIHAALELELPGYRIANLEDQLVHMARLGILDKTGVRTFRMHPEKRGPISSLLRSIDSLHTPKGFQRNLNFALKVITRTDAMHQLMAKAVEFSSGVRSADVRDGRMPSLGRRILSAMRDLPTPTTLAQIRESLEEVDAHRYSDQNLQGALQRLLSKEQISIIGQPGSGAANQYALLPKPKRRPRQ